MGSDRQLKEFDCLIVSNSNGDLVLKFLPKTEFKQDTTNEERHMGTEVSINSYSSSNTEYNEMRRNESLVLSR